MLTRKEPPRDGSPAADSPSGPPTEVLLRGARSGEDSAWREIYERYRTMMMVTIGSRMPGFLRRRYDAEDVLQEAFAKAHANLDSFEYRGEGSLRRWLRTIVYREFQNLLRAQRSERSSLPCDTRAMEEAARVEGGDHHPSRLLSELESRELVLRQMAELPEAEQDLITMRVFERLSWERIGEVLGCSRELASKRFNRTIAHLARELGEAPASIPSTGGAG